MDSLFKGVVWSRFPVLKEKVAISETSTAECEAYPGADLGGGRGGRGPPFRQGTNFFR